MTLHLDITRKDGQPLPAGAALRVEVRDTSLADAPAVVLHRVDHTVPRTGSTSAMPVAIELAAVPDGTTVWAHLAVDGGGRVNRGDFVSTESYPVTNAAAQRISVRLAKVG